MDFYISLSLKDFMLTNNEFEQMSMDRLTNILMRSILLNNGKIIAHDTLRISHNILINYKKILLKKDRHVRFAI